MRSLKGLLVLAITLLVAITTLQAQENVGIGTATPNANAILDLTSTEMGFLTPRMTTLQRVAIFPSGLTDEGLLVYDTDFDQFFYWDGALWNGFPDPAGDGDWFVSNNNIYSAVPGNVGIGVTLPQAKFHVNGSLKLENLPVGTDNTVLVVNNGGDISRRVIGNDIWDGDDVNDADSNPGNEFNLTMNFDPNTQTLSLTDGGSTLTTSIPISGPSDLRFKKNITSLGRGWRNLLQLNGYYYYWKQDDFPDRQFNDERQVGLIAQEVETIFPELVLTDAEGYKAIDYAHMAPLFLEAIKSQQQRIDVLEKELQLLKGEILKVQK